jgi:hypothetical protein
MQAEQSSVMGGGKSLATGTAVKQVAAIVLSILAANRNVALLAQTVILALCVRTETLLKLAHGLPPIQRIVRSGQS